MVYIIPVTGCGTSGKDTIMNTLGGYMVSNRFIKSFDKFDTSENAKSFIEYNRSQVGITSIAHNDIDTKSDLYRSALVDILHGLDKLNLRFEFSIASIEALIREFSKNEFDPECPKDKHLPYLVFVNVREMDLILQFGAYAIGHGYKFMPMVVVRDNVDYEMPNSEVDSQVDYEKQFSESGINFVLFHNNPNDDKYTLADKLYDTARYITSNNCSVSIKYLYKDFEKALPDEVPQIQIPSANSRFMGMIDSIGDLPKTATDGDMYYKLRPKDPSIQNQSDVYNVYMYMCGSWLLYTQTFYSRAVRIGSTWRHFKGEIVTVENIALDSENPDNEFVIYRAESTGKVWARPKEMFLSEIDKDKYPKEYKEWKYRFTRFF